MRVTIRNSNAPLLIREEAKLEAENQDIYFNDIDSYSWFFDFKYRGYWVSSVDIANDHSYMVIDIVKA